MKLHRWHNWGPFLITKAFLCLWLDKWLRWFFFFIFDRHIGLFKPFLVTKVTGDTHGYMDMRNANKNWSKHVFGCRLIPPLACKSVDNLQWDYMKGFSVDEDRACSVTEEESRWAIPVRCVCVSAKPLWAAASSLHQGIYSSQPK